MAKPDLLKKDDYLVKIIDSFKTPALAQINALKSFLVTAGEKISTEEKDLIELTLNSCRHIQNLTEIYSLVHKLNYENLRLNYEKFDFNDLIVNCLKEFSILLKYYEINIAFLPKNEIIINADKNKIKKVIENLVIESINQAFKKSTMELNISQNKNFLVFEIKSRSPYIDVELMDECFRKNKSNTSVMSKTVKELGFYLSGEIINAHYGTMIVKSFPDNINIFGFAIPLN